MTAASLASMSGPWAPQRHIVGCGGRDVFGRHQWRRQGRMFPILWRSLTASGRLGRALGSLGRPLPPSQLSRGCQRPPCPGWMFGPGPVCSWSKSCPRAATQTIGSLRRGLRTVGFQRPLDAPGAALPARPGTKVTPMATAQTGQSRPSVGRIRSEEHCAAVQTPAMACSCEHQFRRCSGLSRFPFWFSWNVQRCFFMSADPLCRATWSVLSLLIS